MNRTRWSLVMAGLVVTAACGRQASYRTVAEGTAGATTVTLSTPSGVIQPGRNNLQLRFSGVGDHPRDVGNATIVVRLGAEPVEGINRGSSIQQSPPLNRISRGVYRTRYDLDFGGPYQFIVTWNDGGQSQAFTFSANLPMVQQTPNAVDQVGGPPAASPGPATIPEQPAGSTQP
jgi:hypothetical protein